MERQLERQRGPEPSSYDYNYEVRFITQMEDREKVMTLPRVFNLKELLEYKQGESVMSRGAGRSHIFGQHTVYDRLTGGPLYSFTSHYLIMKPGDPRKGAHRHQAEAMFYVLKGKGFDRHDGVDHHFEAGDLVAIPQYRVHQHFYDPEEGAEVLITISRIDHFLGLYWREQHEFSENPQFAKGLEPIYDSKGMLAGYRISEGLVNKKQKALEITLGTDKRVEEIYTSRRKITRWNEPVKTSYDYYLKLLAEESKWWQDSPQVIKSKDMPWEDTRQGRLKFLAHPSKPFACAAFDAYLQEIPPGSRSGKHRHMSEELHLILKGKGYDIHDGVRYDWAEGDLVVIPVMTAHQHFNADPLKPAQFYAVQPRYYSSIFQGGFEQMEDAPGER